LLICTGTRSEDEIKHTAEHLGATVIDAISSPYPVDLLQLSIGASAGFAHFPSMGASGAQLYEKADYALFKAKTQSPGQMLCCSTRLKTRK
jgi:predicted signal transduction protein with EAL and GGDEF domain